MNHLHQIINGPSCNEVGLRCIIQAQEDGGNLKAESSTLCFSLNKFRANYDKIIGVVFYSYLFWCNLQHWNFNILSKMRHFSDFSVIKELISLLQSTTEFISSACWTAYINTKSEIFSLWHGKLWKDICFFSKIKIDLYSLNLRYI